jgi:CheY-like chemotaxis protein
MPDVDGFTLARRIKHDRALRRTPVVMLTSAGRPGDTARCRRIGVEACVVKPVKASDLLDTLATILSAPGRRLASPAPRAAGRSVHRPLRILVAEDNRVGRKLLTTLLRKRGHKVTTVETGRAAVDVLDSAPRPFDVVLMDVQMPEMGGFEATRMIRARETSSGRHVPIIALTAHALQGDRERCLEAGMDGYLSKPIDVDQLLDTVEKLPGAVASPGAREAGGSAAADVVFDETKALVHTAGDRTLLGQVIAMLRSDLPSYMKKIAVAIERDDANGLRMAAHGLKGSLATVGSNSGEGLASKLERIGKAGELDEAAEFFVQLQDLVGRLERAFTAAGFGHTGSRRGPSPPGGLRAAARKRGAR